MQSTPTPEETDPHDVFEIAPGVVLAARPDHASATLAPDVVVPASAPQTAMLSDVVVPDAAAPVPPVDATFRAASVDDVLVRGDRTSTEKWVSRAVLSLFAMCVAVAAAAWQHYGDTAKQMIASWTSPLTVASSPPAQKPPVTTQPAAPTVQTAAQTPAPTQATAPAAPPVAPAATSTDTTQLQSMTRDLAAMGQQIEQLKASIAQLKAGQEQMAQQMSRDFARSAEARSSEARAAEHPRIAPLPPRSAASALRKPKPTVSPTPAAMVSPLPPPPPAVTSPALPPPPVQATVQPDGEAVVRPPLPVR
jgi:hypothetical protein